MKNKRHIIFLCLITVLFGCDNTTNKPNSENTIEQAITDVLDEGETQCVYSKTTKKVNETFPFNVADKIEVISYTCRTCLKDYRGSDSLIVDNKFTVKNIKDNITLNKKNTDTLFSILFDYKKKRKGNIELEASCYSPRHSIVFYQDNKAICFLEICFECFQYRNTKNVDFGEFCDDKYCKLNDFFLTIGIKDGVTDDYCK